MEGKQILIIGGSSGIGKALLNLLARDNHVTNFSRTKPEVDENFEHHEINILNDELPDLNELDVLIYCPGSINLKPFHMLKDFDFRSDMEINYFGAVRVIQKYHNLLKSGEGSSILMFSTVAVKMGMPFHASIASAKGAVEGLVRSLGAELAPKVRVNAIAPTVTDTPLAEKLLKNDRLKGNTIDRHPLKGFLNPEEVAEFGEFLISDKAKSISGRIFEMDYGIVSLKT